MNQGEFIRWIKQHGPSWMASLALHLAILGPLCLITWAVTTAMHSEAVLTLSPHSQLPGEGPAGDETGMGGPGGNTPHAGGHAGNANAGAAVPAYGLAAPAPGAAAAAPGGALAEMPVPSGDANPATDVLLSMAGSLASTGRGAGTGTGPGIGPGWLPGVSPGFNGLVEGMRGQGLDIVLVLDATDSMTPYIEQSKKRLQDIINITTGLVPKARFGVVAFKDYGDDYGRHAVRFTKLSDNAEETRTFLNTITAGGGGDIPEPIHEALRFATDRLVGDDGKALKVMGWKPGRKNVIILISDAPVHATGRQEAYQLARQFASGELHGTINVIDTGGTGTGDATQRRNAPIQDLKQISVEGRGSIFLLDDDQAFFRHLIVSVFGERYRQDVETIIATYVKPL